MMNEQLHPKMKACVKFLVTEAKLKIGKVNAKRKNVNCHDAAAKDKRKENLFANPCKRTAAKIGPFTMTTTNRNFSSARSQREIGRTNQSSRTPGIESRCTIAPIRNMLAKNASIGT